MPTPPQTAPRQSRQSASRATRRVSATSRRWLATLLILLVALAVALPGTPVARAATHTVTSTADSGTGSLRDILAAAQNGDTIDFALPGDAPWTITLDSALPTVIVGLTIQGPGADQLTIRRDAVATPTPFGLLAFSTTTPVTISGVTLTGGSASGNGGAINQQGTGALTLADSTLSGNTASSGGGGFYAQGSVTVTNSTFTGNTAGSGAGGGFRSQAHATVTDSTFTGNAGNGYGGGIGVYGGGITLTNSTVSGNTASGDGGGAAIAGGATVINSTFIGNSTPAGGGALFINDTSLTLTNSLFAQNPSGTNCRIFNPGTTIFQEQGGNISSDTTCVGTSTTSLANTDPKLGALADNGSPMQTHLPAADSPALGFGVAASCPATDQRGVPRSYGAACTSGAVEGTVTLAPSSLPGGNVGTAYSQALAGSGGTAPYTYAVTAGTLPAGLTLGVDGTLAGTPAAVGRYRFTAMATDSGAPPAPYRGVRSYTVVVARGSQEIAFDTPAGSPSYGVGQTFAVGATATSGLPVTFTAGGACTIAGTTVTTTALGGCTVTASQAGDANYLPAPDVVRTIAVILPATVNASVAGGGGSITPSGATTVPVGAQATYFATPDAGYAFLGWTLDGQEVGFASPLTFTVNDNRTLVARFAPRPVLGDVAPTGPAWDAITQLAARGIIKGYSPDDCAARGLTAPCFGPADPVARAQAAALIVRAFGWDTSNPSGPAPFSDISDVDPELQRAIAILYQRGIIFGYGDGTYGPADALAHAQAISVITRAMVQAGYWTEVTVDDPTIYPNVTLNSGHRLDLLTFVTYAGAIPDRPTNQNWQDWGTTASRGWTAQLLWQALSSQFGVDRVP